MAKARIMKCLLRRRQAINPPAQTLATGSSRRTGARTARWVAVSAVALSMPLALFLVLPPAPAEAHALLVRSDPPQNAELRLSPDRVIGFFSEALDQRLSSIQVVDGTGKRVDDEQTGFGPEAERMSIGIKEQLPSGFYTVIWETLSSVDGHLFRGSYPFTVLNEDGSQPSGPKFEASGGGSESTGVEDILVKWGQIGGATALVGSLAFVLWVNGPAAAASEGGWREKSRRAARRRLSWVALPAAGGLILIAGGEVLLQADQLGGFKYVDDVLKNTWGERWIQRQIVLAVIIFALLASVRLWKTRREGLSTAALWVALAGGFAYLLLVAMVSHGAAVPGSFWAVGADFLHLSATAVWVGMLVMLGLFLLWLRRQPNDSARAEMEAEHLIRFSSMAATSVALLLATGTINGLTEVSDLSSLIDTAYGRTLSIKLGVMLVLLAVAGVNAFYLRPRITEEEDVTGTEIAKARRRLGVSVWAELGLAAGVLLMAAILIQHTTSRQVEQVEEARAGQAQSAQAVVGYEDIQPAGNLQVNLTVSPNTPGQNSFRVFLFPRQGGDIGEVLRVRLRFQKQGGELGMSELVLEQAGATAWKGVGPFLSAVGNWTVSVDVRRASVDDVRADFPVPVSSGELAGSDFDLPLAVGSWLTVAGIAALIVGLLVLIWLGDFPVVPDTVYRVLRVGAGLLWAVSVGLIVVSFLPQKEQTGNPITSTPQSIAIGRTLYLQNCQSCHGISGRGDGPQAGSLPLAPADFRVHIPYHQDDFFFRVMTNGLGNIMPAFGSQFTEDERWHLLNFLKSEFGGTDETEPSAKSLASSP